MIYDEREFEIMYHDKLRDLGIEVIPRPAPPPVRLRRKNRAGTKRPMLAALRWTGLMLGAVGRYLSDAGERLTARALRPERVPPQG